jgi:hypothetical protein
MKKDKNKKLHFEVLPDNWDKINHYIESYNKDPKRVTPKIKYSHVVNEAIHLFLKKQEKTMGENGS